MPDFQPPAYVEQNRHTRALAAHRPHPCLICQQWTQTVLYPSGWHCEPCAHTRGLQVGPIPTAYGHALRQNRTHDGADA